MAGAVFVTVKTGSRTVSTGHGVVSFHADRVVLTEFPKVSPPSTVGVASTSRVYMTSRYSVVLVSVSLLTISHALIVIVCQD